VRLVPCNAFILQNNADTKQCTSPMYEVIASYGFHQNHTFSKWLWATN